MFELNVKEDLRLDDVYFFDGVPVAFIFDVLEDVEVPVVKVHKPSRKEGFYVVGGNAHITITNETLKAKKGTKVVLNYYETVLFLTNVERACNYFTYTKFSNCLLGRNKIEREFDKEGYCKILRLTILEEGKGFKSIKDVFGEKSIIKDGRLVEDWLVQDYTVYLEIAKYLEEHGRY